MTFNVLSGWDMQFARFFVHNFTTSPYFTVSTSNWTTGALIKQVGQRTRRPKTMKQAR